MIKTTLYLETDTYYAGKKEALERKLSATKLINDALAYYLEHLRAGKINILQKKESRIEKIVRLRKLGYGSGMKDSVKFQRWVRS